MSLDLLFHGGEVITVDPQNSICSAVGIRGDRIVYVGDEGGARDLVTPGTQVVDLKGRSLVPGFIEAHCHVLGWGTYIDGLDLKGASSVSEVASLVGDMAQDVPKGEWIRGRGYNQLNLEERRHPNRWDLDAAAPHHPVYLVRCCGHITVANSRALELAGLEDDSPDPPGGVMDRDDRGRLNGVLRETAQHPVRTAGEIPEETLREHYSAGCADLIKWGITSAHDMGRPVTAETLASWHRADRIPLRVFATLSPDDEHLLPDRGGSITYLGGDLFFRFGHLKVFADGSSSGPTAATREPYACDPGDRGVVVTSQEEITSWFTRANGMGFSVTAHAVGDRGIEMTLAGQEAASKDRPRRGLNGEYSSVPRHRIEHCAMAFPDLRRRMKALSVIPAGQAIFLEEYGDNYLNDYGPQRAESMFPLKSFWQEGIPVALSSDAPVSHPDPLKGLAAAMNRRTRAGQVLGPGEKLTLQEAIRCYTLHGAYAEHAEDLKGSIQVGKLADLAVVDGPLAEAGPDEVAEMRVDMTVVGGQVQYQR